MQMGNLEMLKVLLEESHKLAQAVHAQDDDGFTPVLLAAQHGHFDAVAYMLQFSAPPPPVTAADVPPPKPKHSLLLAAEQGLPVVLAWLLAFSSSQVRSCTRPLPSPLPCCTPHIHVSQRLALFQGGA